MKGTTCTTMNRKLAENKGRKGGKNQIIFLERYCPISYQCQLTNLQSVNDRFFFL